MGIALGDYEARVQVAFDAGPFNASPTWTDITEDVLADEGLTFSRGARSVGGKPGPGLADLRVKNWAEGSKVAGRWTPGVAAGPWHPLKLKRRFRIQARYAGGSWVDLWGGHLTDYTPSWIGAGKAVCDLSASDLLSALSLLKAFPNAILAEQLYDDPVLCYPLDDSEGSVTAGDRTSGARPSLTVAQLGSGGTIDFGSGSFGPEASTCAAFTRVDGANGKYLVGSLAGLGMAATDPRLTVEAFVKPGPSADYLGLLGVQSSDGLGGNDWVGLATGLGGQTIIRGGTLAGSVTAGTGAYLLPDTWHHVVMQLEMSAGTMTAYYYVDAALQGYCVVPLDPHNMATLWVGRDRNILAPFDGQIAGVAVYPYLLSGARIADHYLALTGWAGELTGGRFQRLCRLAGLPSGLISVASSTGGGTMGAQPVGGKTLTSSLNEVAATEQGSVEIDRTGLLRFAGRDLRRGAPSLVTLDARTDILNDFEGLPYNDEGLLNDVTVSRVGGATQRAVNAASALELGTISDSIEVYVEDDGQALSLAEWLANINAEAQLRAPVIKVSMAALAARSPAKVPTVMAFERGQRLTVSDLPDGLPATTLDLFVEGMSDAWGKNDWIRTITTSSLWRNGAVWILGDPFYSVLGTSTILGY